jgi:hypothetical protein
MSQKKFVIRNCGDCPFYVKKRSLEMGGRYQEFVDCRMGYLKSYDTRDWDLSDTLWKECKLKETEVIFSVEGGKQ